MTLHREAVACLACEAPTCWARRSCEGPWGLRTAVHVLLVRAVTQSGVSAGRGLDRLVNWQRHPTTRPAAQLTVIVPQVAARVFRRTGHRGNRAPEKSAEKETRKENG